MITVNMHEAKTHLSALLQKVEEQGESILVCRSGHPIAEIHAVRSTGRNSLPAPDPDLAVALHYDPTEPASSDEWPEASR